MSEAVASHAHDSDHHHGPNHDYHLLDPSIWPLFCSIAALFLFVALTGWLEGSEAFAIKFRSLALRWLMFKAVFHTLLTMISLAVLVFGMFGWWFDVIKEKCWRPYPNCPGWSSLWHAVFHRK